MYNSTEEVITALENENDPYSRDPSFAVSSLRIVGSVHDYGTATVVLFRSPQYRHENSIEMSDPWFDAIL